MDAVVVADGEFVARLVERRLDAAYRLARAILLDDAEAEDAVQETSLAAWRRRSSLRDADRFEAWFDRIVINACRDRLRRRRRLQVRAIALDAAWREPTDDPRRDDAELDASLDAALDELDPEHRVVVLLRYWLDLPLEGIADRLDIPVGTVKSRLHYSLRTIRARLEATDGRS